MTAERRPATQPAPPPTNAVVLALAAMVRADIRRTREQRASLRVMGGGKR